jgi:hypothetical protein
MIHLKRLRVVLKYRLLALIPSPSARDDPMNSEPRFWITLGILGLWFLAFAAVSIYSGEFNITNGEIALGAVGDVVITRAHDPEAFWRVVIVEQLGTGCFLLYLSYRLARIGG